MSRKARVEIVTGDAVVNHNRPRVIGVGLAESEIEQMR
jgi:hypothetical protein